MGFTCWLDRVLAAPVIGLRFHTSFAAQHRYLDAVEQVIERWKAAGHHCEFSSEGQLDLRLQFTNGFGFAVSPGNVVVDFQYRPKLIEPPGKVPQLEYKIPPQAFSSLLERMTDDGMDFIAPISGVVNRPLNRIGIVADCRIDRSEAPPGVLRYLQHLASPWETDVDRCATAVTVVLDRQDSHLDRCHHHLAIDSEEQGDALKLRLDWQRYYEPALALDGIALRKSIIQCAELAVAYFERFALGDLAYGS